MPKTLEAHHSKTILAALLPLLFIANSAAPAAQVTGTEKSAHGLTIHCGNSIVRLDVWDDHIMRVRFARAGTLTDPAISAVIAQPAITKFEWTNSPDYAGVKTSAMEAQVDRRSGTVCFVDAVTGKPFLSEAPDGRSTTTTRVGEQTIHGPAQTFIRQPGEAIIGLGQHPDGQFDYTNTTIHLQQENTKIAVPVLTSSAGYTLLWDNAAVTDVSLTQDAVKWSSENGDTTDYYVCYGPDLNEAISGYRKLTGDAPMFARWVWGLWQSRERYITQADILATALEYRRRQIPIDGMVQDWQYWFPQPWGSHAFGTHFPDPAGLVKALHDHNFHCIISVWAKFDQGSKNYDELQAAGDLYPPIYPNVYPPGKSKWYDAFNPAARAMYWRQINDEIGIYGWDGWWLDATEPELSGKWGEMRNLQTGAGPGYAVFNAYPLMTTAGVYAGQKARTPPERPFILTRSAYAGQQRNAAVSWSGDIQGTWDVLKKQIPAGLNFVASGIPYWNTDTGGFFGGNPSDPDYRELFTRWFQFSTFCPLLRIHGTGPHKPLWAFGDDTQRTLVTFDQLRYRLLPYIYSTAWQVTANHASMMRPLLLDYRNDPNVYAIGDQFMFGPGLMVCPVTQPIAGSLAAIPPANLVDATGHPGGLSAVYYQGENFDQEITHRIDPTIDFNWDKVKREGVGPNPHTDPIPGLTMDHFSVRWNGFLQTQLPGTYSLQLSADDGMRLWIGGKQVVDDWHARKLATTTVKLDLPASTRIPIRIEYFQNINAAIIDLRWKPPTPQKPGPFTRKVYLPAGTWFDFWTGKTFPGNHTIDAPAPIERLPLFVKSGTILPMGPVVQFASEQPNAPLELRIYPGADGQFLLYDDAGDGFGYESWQHATIPFSWNDHTATLSIGARQGAYPGMPARRQFRVVWVHGDHGAGPDETPTADQIVDYDGSARQTQLRR